MGQMFIITIRQGDSEISSNLAINEYRQKHLCKGHAIDGSQNSSDALIHALPHCAMGGFAFAFMKGIDVQKA
jgi:hypothetical protein